MVTEKDIEDNIGTVYSALLELLDTLLLYHYAAIDYRNKSKGMPPDHRERAHEMVRTVRGIIDTVFSMTETIDKSVLPALEDICRETALPVEHRPKNRMYK